jgi:hypothetical protein
MEPKIYRLHSKEVHMFGDYVGVVWNTEQKKRTIIGEDGLAYSAQVAVRSGEPYIDFVWIRGEDADEPWEDEDSPVEGGLDADSAVQIATELQRAAIYLRSL